MGDGEKNLAGSRTAAAELLLGYIYLYLPEDNYKAAFDEPSVESWPTQSHICLFILLGFCFFAIALVSHFGLLQHGKQVINILNK